MTDEPRHDGSQQFPSEFGPPFSDVDQPAGGPRGPGLAGDHVPTSPTLVADSVISSPLRERMLQDDQPIGVIIELRLRYPDGLPAAAARVHQLVRELRPEADAPPVVVTSAYVTTALTADEIRQLVQADSMAAEAGNGSPTETVRAARDAIYRIWPNFRISALTYRSVVTTKCQAVHRSFNATGRGLVWAVLDSGIDGSHPHFEQHKNLVGLPHRSFVDADDALALRDDAGHGTHVAGILAGQQTAEPGQNLTGLVAYWDDNAGQLRTRETTFPSICGMAPECKLLSCKVLRADESGDLTGLLAALQYIADLNHGGRDLQVHGVNISVGHPFDPSWFATGLTPVCREVDNLVRSGVVVVVAAGNTGYGYATDRRTRPIRLGFDMTINDPGNAALALTVGSTSSSPHSTGVSYFSSKGPTGDGRMKPDLVAPGERVVSAAAGALLDEAQRVSSAATYIENSGTSMAAPHVSGAAAAFLSVHREFIGKPQAVGKALMSTATDLGRAANFQGAGLIDAMRAIQSV